MPDEPDMEVLQTNAVSIQYGPNMSIKALQDQEKSEEEF